MLPIITVISFMLLNITYSAKRTRTVNARGEELKHSVSNTKTPSREPIIIEDEMMDTSENKNAKPGAI